GVVGVTVGTEEKDYASSNIHSVTSKEQLPSLTADSETEVPVLITYNDGSQENTAVTLKVAPVAPNVTVQPQDGTTGDLTLTIKRHDDTKYPDDSVVTVPGIDGTFKVKDGTIRIKNDQLKDKVQTGKVTVTEGTKLPAETDGDKTIPAKKVLSATPTFTVGTQNPQTGNVEVTVDGVPEGTKVKLPGIASEKVVTGGKVELSHNELPENPTTGKGIAQEDGKLPKEGTSDITIPGKLTSAKGEPAREFEVTIPLPIVVPDPEHLTPEEKTELEKKVKKSNPNMDVKVDDKGNVTITDPKTGQSKVIPVKDLTVKDFTPVKPTDKVPVKDKAHLTPEEKKQVADKVKAKNPGKEVTVGDDGTATVTDPTTGISHTIPGTDLVNQDFEPVKPTEKVPVKDKSHLTPEEKKQVADKVKDKNPGKDVTVGDDGTATVTDPNTGISHDIPGTDLVNQDFEPVKPTDKVLVKDKSHLTPEEKKQVADKVKDKNPGKDVTVGDDGTATVTDPTTGISHEIPGTDLVNQDFEPVKPTDKVLVKDKSHLTPEEKKQVVDKVKAKNPGKDVTVGDDGTATVTDPTTGISHTIPGTDLVIEFAKGDSTRLEVPGLIITKWTDELGNDLKQPDSKAPSVLGEANEAFEHGEIEGYVFVRTETKGDVVTHVFRKVSPVRPTGDGQQGPATPSADTNRRPDTATPAEVPAAQPAEQPSQTAEVPAQLPNEVSETDSSVSQPQAVLPNTGTKADRATGVFGVLSLLGAFGLLFAKKKKDDEEEA
uniref:LPXTG cell wall anchor domain-containing protein n=1 Tax=Streptococcus sp. 5346 TaxID=2582636 RepID=UPI001564632D